MPQSTTNLGLPLFEAGDNAENWCKGINFAGNANSAFKKIDDFAGTIKGITGTVTLLANQWVGTTYTLTLSALGANDSVFFTPSSIADKTAAEQAGIFIDPNPVGTAVTITASTAPAGNISFEYSIMRG